METRTPNQYFIYNYVRKLTTRPNRSRQGNLCNASFISKQAYFTLWLDTNIMTSASARATISWLKTGTFLPVVRPMLHICLHTDIMTSTFARATIDWVCYVFAWLKSTSDVWETGCCDLQCSYQDEDYNLTLYLNSTNHSI